MRRIENQCVGCETCTLGSGCSLLHVVVYSCDRCGDDAEYHIDGLDYCTECAEEYLNSLFHSLDIEEKAEVIDASIESLI